MGIDRGIYVTTVPMCLGINVHWPYIQWSYWNMGIFPMRCLDVGVQRGNSNGYEGGVSDIFSQDPVINVCALYNFYRFLDSGHTTH